MTGKQKDRLINTAIGMITGFSIIMFGAFWNGKKDEELATKEDIANKLDKIEFSEYKQEHKKDHAIEYATDKEFRDWMREQFKDMREEQRVQFESLRSDIRNKH